ncbi:MAG: COX15/CtaA family protein, partial [Polymorphobacter sp.]
WVVPFALLLVVQIGFGAFVAGLRAGHIYTMWPLMGDGLVPPELGLLAPLWRNLLDNPVTVQFIHRGLALLVALAAFGVAWQLVRAGAANLGGALAAMVLVQFALGVLTLVHAVPIPLGVAHQAGAAVLVGITVLAAHWCWQGRAARLAR